MDELYNEFLSQYPKEKVSISKFVTLRPKQCVWGEMSGIHNTCTCEIHQNFRLLLDASNIKEKTSVVLQKVLCPLPSFDCYFWMCQNCPKKEEIDNLFTEIDEEEITFQFWEKDENNKLHLKK